MNDGTTVLTGATLTSLSITVTSLFLGVNGTGFQISSGTLAIDIVRPAAAADTRRWTAVSASFTNVDADGIDGLTLTASSIKVEINQASAGATPLGWSSVPGSGLTLSGSLLRLSATAHLDIGGFVYASGTFVFQRGDDLFVTPAGANSTVHVSLLEIGVTADFFAGSGGVGVSLSGIQVGVALMREITTGTPRTYYALSGGGTAQLVGVPDITLLGSLNVNVNKASAGAAIDFSLLPGGKLTIATGPTSSVDLAFTGTVLKVTGSLTLAIDSFAYITGDFGFEQGVAQSVTLDNGVTGNVTFLKIGASNASAFFGVNGPASNAGAMGLSITGVSFALALGTPDAALAAASGMKSFFALKATGSVSLVGVSGITASITGATIAINDATPTTAGATPHAINFSAHSLTVGGLTLDFAGKLFQASGTVTLSIGDFVYLTGTVTFQKGTTLTAQPLSTGTADLTALTIAASGVTAFVGNGYGTPGAIGLQLTGVNFGLALLKPTAPGATASYFALEATATSVSLVGITGFTFDVTEPLTSRSTR